MLNNKVKQLKKIKIKFENMAVKINKKIVKNQRLEESVFQKIKNYVYKNK